MIKYISGFQPEPTKTININNLEFCSLYKDIYISFTLVCSCVDVDINYPSVMICHEKLSGCKKPAPVLKSALIL